VLRGPSGGGAYITSLSCGAAGDCAVAGSYSTSPQGGTAFVATESGGRWHAAMQVPGLAALNTRDIADVGSLSCPSPGNCLAGGTYENSTHRQEVFVVSELKGAWQRAKEVPGTAALNEGGDDGITSVSCATAGNCAIGGFIADGAAFVQAFVASQSNGIWHNAQEVPGIALLSKGLGSGVGSVSCGSPGNCSAAGGYVQSPSAQEAFVVSEVSIICLSSNEPLGPSAGVAAAHDASTT